MMEKDAPTYTLEEMLDALGYKKMNVALRLRLSNFVRTHTIIYTHWNVFWGYGLVVTQKGYKFLINANPNLYPPKKRWFNKFLKNK